jgi:hypothetical protein
VADAVAQLGQPQVRVIARERRADQPLGRVAVRGLDRSGGRGERARRRRERGEDDQQQGGP